MAFTLNYVELNTLEAKRIRACMLEVSILAIVKGFERLKI